MAKRRVENYVFSPGISYKAYVHEDAYNLLSSNKNYIIAEAIEYINNEISEGNAPFAGYTYNESKCERDIGFILNAYLNDLRYGGNKLTRKYISRYFENGVAQIDGDRQPEVYVHTYIRDLITDYIFTNTAFSSLQAVEGQIIDATKIISNSSFTPTAATYKPATGVLTLTIGTHSLQIGDEIYIAEDGLRFTCALDGHATYHDYPRGSGVPNATGHDGFFEAPCRITARTDTTVTVNVGISSDTSTHLFVSAVANCVKTGPSNVIDVLAGRVVDVIANGLNRRPDLVDNRYGYLKVQGKYGLSDLLLISNSTTNDILFNFTNNDFGAVLEVNSAETFDVVEDDDFPAFLQTTDGITKIKLNADTSNASSTDDIQIFVEEKELRTRPYDFGTDAIERMRVAPALSMLDADFEYGLQPTKWSAIGMMRGYPSIYEVPGSEIQVQSVTTDASTGTGGIGASLITVTTTAAHGFIAGDPITIKALENSVAGASRAEGSFVIITVPTSTTFTYYAKAKVGTTGGEVLSTTYTQLRAAGFYTGANISSLPVFTVASNGFSGAMVAELEVASGSTIIPYDGNAPELGAPLVHSGGNIPTGAQVTQTITQSSGGGTYLTADLVGDAGTGTNTLEVADATGIITGLAFDRGDGQAIFVNNIIGEQIEFDGNFSRTILGNTTTYAEISGSNISGVGFDATFDVSLSGGAYTVVVNNGGEAYEVGDRIYIAASQIGGIEPANDLVIIVDSVISLGTIVNISIEGTAFNGTATIAGLQPEVNGGLGFNATFDITYEGGAYTSVTMSNENSEGFTPYDIIQVSGSSFSGGGLGTNDAFVTVQTVDSLGRIETATVSGTAPTANVEYSGIDAASYTYSGTTGAGAEFTINRNGTVYSAAINSPGTNYLPTETFTIDGSLLGGATTTNDCTITIDNVDGGGGITAVSVSGVALDTDTGFNVTGTNLIGNGAEFTVDISGGSYTITVDLGGEDYGVNQTFTILGSELAGQDGINDLEITITALGDLVTRDISTVSGTGSAATGTASYTAIAGVNQEPIGTGATFDVLRTGGAYTITLVSGGLDYEVGNRITLLGTQLGGQSPVNDITITVSTVAAGVITTFASAYEEAVFGDIGDFIATVTISEATTGIISKLDAITFSALASLQIQFPNAHGLVPGDTFITTIETDDGVNNHNLAAGAFIVTDIPQEDQLTFVARAAGNIDTSTSIIEGSVYPRPDSFFIHRPYDGGVQLGTGGPQHGAQAIRQSKNYIRYQSGKGIMYTTGALFAPSYDLRSVTADGTEVGSTITIVTDDNDHGVQVGGVIRLIGVETEGYNSGPETYFPPVFDYTVTRVVDERTFEVEAQRRLGATSAVLGFAAQMSVVSWHGATVRSGIFDDQNGIFWEYDGTQISVVQRTGTKQVAGTIAMTVDDNLVAGTNTRFRDQLKAGDRIIIKGMTHVISKVEDQTTMYVTPDFRGVNNIAGTKAMLITDKKVKQSEFNLDRLDGTGPSGYDLDPAKMQMIGIQYSWYGAGFIDFMLRGSDGNFVFAHRMRNSNVNTEAFMRSGNLPVRYEVTNEGPPGKLAEDMDISQTTLELEDSSFFPTTGTVYIDNEIIRFTGNNKTTNTLTGLTRGTTHTNFQAGATRAYAAGDAAVHSAKTGVILISSTITPLISHWGSAFLTDGGFDEDRGYIFSYTESSIPVDTTKQTAFLIRLAPSVSNAITGDLGERELLNRAQLLLQGIEVTSETGTGGIVVEGVLNPKNYPLSPADITWSTLTTEAQGGQPSFAQIASGGSVNWSTGAAATTATITAQGTITTSPMTTASNNSDDEFEITEASYESFGPVLPGSTINGLNFPAGTTVSKVQQRNNGQYRITASDKPTGFSASGSSVTFTYGGDLTNRNYAFLQKASFESSNATFGTQMTSGGSVTFPANTAISFIQLLNHGGTEFYGVVFNNSFSGTLTAGSGTVETTFVEPPYAQPGETVFSFIANPGERSVLSLDKLKELTNTTLGGRGTFPNGPDVLAINVYKVTGASVDANIILRWGEAQA